MKQEIINYIKNNTPTNKWGRFDQKKNVDELLLRGYTREEIYTSFEYLIKVENFIPFSCFNFLSPFSYLIFRKNKKYLIRVIKGVVFPLPEKTKNWILISLVLATVLIILAELLTGSFWRITSYGIWHGFTQ